MLQAGRPPSRTSSIYAMASWSVLLGTGGGEAVRRRVRSQSSVRSSVSGEESTTSASSNNRWESNLGSTNDIARAFSVADLWFNKETKVSNLSINKDYKAFAHNNFRRTTS